MVTLYPIIFEAGDNHVVFVAFDERTANEFVAKENDAVQCDMLAVYELPLVDNYGYLCKRSEAAFVAPWISEASTENLNWYGRN